MTSRPNQPRSGQVLFQTHSSPDQIADFLRGLSAIRHPKADAAGTREKRLKNLFHAISSFKKGKRSVASEYRYDVNRIASFLPDLQRGLLASRHDGRLLNVWTVAGLKRKEVPTAAVLGWLLDCNGSHGFSSAVLDALLNILARRYPTRNLRSVRLGYCYRLAVEHSSFGENSNRVDLVIDCENAVIFIEIKIDAPQRENQLADYLDLARKRASAFKKPIFCLLYLSRSVPENAPDDVFHLRWNDVANAVSSAIPASAKATVSAAILRQFAEHVKRLH